ncbi:hypothetical protein AB0I98_49710, partial [Streptomyces sp. NPDC050211]|uniref:hypothetical protein n=1 Tax=Streptomyces sp. NPDC050211 TaxID=3154932 RepID=UPI0034120270
SCDAAPPASPTSSKLSSPCACPAQTEVENGSLTYVTGDASDVVGFEYRSRDVQDVLSVLVNKLHA